MLRNNTIFSKHTLTILFCISICIQSVSSQSVYFPPLTGDAWETTDPETLGWCTPYIDTLYDFLEAENTKAFLVLKDGRIVLEKYFGTFQQDSLWYWASAGKTITAFLVGKAQENGDVDIDASSNTYLGEGWTDCTSELENNITIRNQLTMTSGLDDGVPDNHCTIDTCLQYLADAGTRWAYHNAPYTLLESVLENATGTDINTFTYTQLKLYTGMTGFWLTLDYDNVYFSNARSMARFGLLMQNNGVWNSTAVMNDAAYFNQMINTSQEINLSYGYLWWLNGKASFMLPGTQLVFPGAYAPDAPADMYAGLGKNGQMVSIANSAGLVFVRMGNAPEDYGDVPAVLCNAIWKHLNTIMCSATGITDRSIGSAISVFPNPADNYCTIALPGKNFNVTIYNLRGQKIFAAQNINGYLQYDTQQLPPGYYSIVIQPEQGDIQTSALIKN